MSSAAENRSNLEPASRILGRYRTVKGARVLSARHEADQTVITDQPASGHGEAYWVETIPHRDGAGAVDALAHEYICDARRQGSAPMGRTVGRELEGVA